MSSDWGLNVDPLEGELKWDEYSGANTNNGASPPGPAITATATNTSSVGVEQGNIVASAGGTSATLPDGTRFVMVPVPQPNGDVLYALTPVASPDGISTSDGSSPAAAAGGGATQVTLGADGNGDKAETPATTSATGEGGGGGIPAPDNSSSNNNATTTTAATTANYTVFSQQNIPPPQQQQLQVPFPAAVNVKQQQQQAPLMAPMPLLTPGSASRLVGGAQFLPPPQLSPFGQHPPHLVGSQHPPHLVGSVVPMISPLHHQHHLQQQQLVFAMPPRIPGQIPTPTGAAMITPHPLPPLITQQQMQLLQAQQQQQQQQQDQKKKYVADMISRSASAPNSTTNSSRASAHQQQDSKNPQNIPQPLDAASTPTVVQQQRNSKSQSPATSPPKGGKNPPQQQQQQQQDQQHMEQQREQSVWAAHQHLFHGHATAQLGELKSLNNSQQQEQQEGEQEQQGRGSKSSSPASTSSGGANKKDNDRKEKQRQQEAMLSKLRGAPISLTNTNDKSSANTPLSAHSGKCQHLRQSPITMTEAQCINLDVNPAFQERPLPPLQSPQVGSGRLGRLAKLSPTSTPVSLVAATNAERGSKSEMTVVVGVGAAATTLSMPPQQQQEPESASGLTVESPSLSTSQQGSLDGSNRQQQQPPHLQQPGGSGLLGVSGGSLHDDELGDERQNSNSTSPAGKAEQEGVNPDWKPALRRKPCRFLKERGTCKYGDKCLFDHSGTIASPVPLQ